MKRLRFEYTTDLCFSDSVTEHSFTLRCLPFSDGRQLITEPVCEVFPANGSIWRSRDSFGNLLICGRSAEPHTAFSFRVRGEAQIINSCKIPGSAPAFYRFQTPMTLPGAAILSFYAEHRPNCTGILLRAKALADSLFRNFAYIPGITGVDTTAEEAMKLGGGVCQDYAHILLSLLRLDGIRCRYASGLAFSCGETHAWVEIYDGACWTGIDPSHNRLIGDHYIKLCHGRDYSDCPIERGIYRGRADGIQTVSSEVVEC